MLTSQIEKVLAGNLVTTSATIGDIRNVAILAEVHKSGGIVSSTDLSAIARKYGKDPKGSAGYFKGNYPSMKGIAGDKRALTDEGVSKVNYANELYGEDWLDRLPLNIISNPATPNNTEISF